MSICNNKEISGALWQPRGVGVGREVQEGGDIHIPMADSCWWMAETNTILQSNYPTIKNTIYFLKREIMWTISEMKNDPFGYT